MRRRLVFSKAFAAIGAALALAPREARASAPGVPRVVYHLTDAEKVAFVLGNIDNHIEGMGGPDKVTLALVVHGPALRAFHAANPDREVARRVTAFTAVGVGLHACGNTMRAQKIGLADLMPGFVVAEEGGVVRIAKLQADGWLYLRP